ncbi:MAG TPA: hypothetical protein VH854_07845 [Thermoanaerobaculia bacterium]|jgi:hypothetical protein|nr:hypothetical protein [Thermoanaerobaculia bacterium]
MSRRALWTLAAGALVLFLARDALVLRLTPHRRGPRPDVASEPRQEPGDRQPFERQFGGHRYRVTPRFRWDESARVVSERPYRWGRTAAVLPEDLALAWGPVLAPPYAGRISYSQFSRFYFWRANLAGLDRGTIVSHTANTHVIPSTIILRRAVRALSKGDDVRLEGWLVEVDGIDDPSFHWGTSTTRDDEGPNSCETVYLERLTVGERVYE